MGEQMDIRVWMDRYDGGWADQWVGVDRYVGGVSMESGSLSTPILTCHFSLVGSPGVAGPVQLTALRPKEPTCPCARSHAGLLCLLLLRGVRPSAGRAAVLTWPPPAKGQGQLRCSGDTSVPWFVLAS